MSTGEVQPLQIYSGQDINNEELKGIEAPLFYQTARVGKIIGISLLAISATGGAATLLNIKKINDASACLVALALFTTCYGANLGISFIADPYYNDPEQRKAYNQELTDRDLTLSEFIQKHTWSNIVRFGFEIADKNQPLLSKSQFANIAIEQAAQTPSKLFTTVDLKLDPFPHYPFTIGLLWQAIHYDVFSEEQIQTIQSLFANEKDVTASLLLENYSYLQTFGFLDKLSKPKKAWLASFEKEYTNIKQHYSEMINRSFKLYNSRLNAAKIEKSSRRSTTLIHHQAIKNLLHKNKGSEKDIEKGISVGNDVYFLYSAYDSDQIFLARVEESKKTLVNDLEKFNSYFSHHLVRLNRLYAEVA